MRKLALLFAIPLILFGALLSASAFAQEADADAAEVMAELTETLELTDEQVPQVAAAFESFLKGMEAATAQADDAEPDPQKMIGDIKKVRSAFKKDMENALTKEQFQKFETMVDAIFQETFEDIAEIRIIDLEPVLDLTEEQSAALVPVMGTAMRDIVATLFEYGDKRMGMRTKVKLGKTIKRIQSDMEKGMSEVLTPEQMEQYKAYVEAQKEAKEEG